MAEEDKPAHDAEKGSARQGMVDKLGLMYLVEDPSGSANAGRWDQRPVVEETDVTNLSTMLSVLWEIPGAASSSPFSRAAVRLRIPRKSRLLRNLKLQASL